MTFIVRQAKESDVESLSAYFRTIYPNQDHLRERWVWLNLQNPFFERDLGLPFWIAVQDEKIIGYVGMMAVPVKFGEDSVIGYWGVDLFTDPTARGMGVGKALLSKLLVSHRLFMALEITDLNRAIHLKMGVKEGPSTKTFYRIRQVLFPPLYEDVEISFNKRFGNKSAWIAKCLKGIGIINMLGRGLERKIKKKQVISQADLLYGFRFDRVSRFDEQADILWQTIRQQFNLTVERNSAYLNWKFVDQPYVHYRIFYIKLDDEVQGVLIIRKGEFHEQPTGLICECFLRNPSIDKYAEIIQYAVSVLFSQGVCGIWVATSDDLLEKALITQGFLGIGQQKIMINFPAKLIVEDEPVLSRQLNPMHMSKGDHDWDQYLKLRQPSFKQLYKLASKRG